MSAQETSLEYDIVIMGCGIAGLCQARHLLLNIPNLKIALIDPRPEERDDKDHKLGESTVEISSLFICKDLGLNDYMIENHPPKMGLNFHWCKENGKTETIDDYYSIWVNRQPSIPTFQIHRPKFERDLLKMNQEMGATFYNGRVFDVEIGSENTSHVVKVKCNNGGYLELKTQHLIDAAGRKFIIGQKTDNLIFKSEDLQGVHTGSAWVRIKNVDRTIFHSGYDPYGTAVSQYYATNHFFGKGHWLWMIPIDRQEQEISLGVIHHHDVISSKEINTREKFDAFLKANHTMLYKLINSGQPIDFHYWPRLAHKSKTLFSSDNWYVLGDAAAIFDAFYSLGITMIALQIESVTEIIRAKRAGEANAEQKRAIYNQFNLTYIDAVNTFVSKHSQHLGNASLMSWRIYFEYMWWFGVLVPMYVGKWHLDMNFLKEFIGPWRAFLNGVIAHVYERLDILAERGANIGFMDPVRADQLIGKYYTFKRFDDFLENAKLEPKRCNISLSMKSTLFYLAIWYLKFQWKGFGLAGLLSPRTIYYFFYLLVFAGLSALAQLRYKLQTWNVPNNSEIERTRQEFKNYSYQDQLQSWSMKV